MNTHEHKGQVFAVDGDLYCQDCLPKEKQGGNECFCTCHVKTVLPCKKCLPFHQGGN